MIVLHGRRGFIERASPSFDLIDSIFRDTLFLVFPHQISIIPFVQSPTLVDGNVFLSQFHEHNIRSSNAATQQTRMDLVKLHVGIAQHLSRHSRFENALVGQWSVGPPNEAIVAIPSALTVAQETQGKWSRLI